MPPPVVPPPPVVVVPTPAAPPPPQPSPPPAGGRQPPAPDSAAAGAAFGAAAGAAFGAAGAAFGPGAGGAKPSSPPPRDSDDGPVEDEWGQLRRSPSDDGGGGPSKGKVIAITLGILVLAAAGAWWWLNRDAAPPEPDAEEVVEAPEPAATAEPDTPPLPALDDSDAFLRDLFSALTSNPEILAFLLGEDLARHLAIAVDNVADGVSPRRALRAFMPVDEFRVTGEGDDLQVDPASFARYDSLAAAMADADMARVAEAVVRVLPLLETAYAELGRTDRSFREALDQAVSRLTDVPVPEPPILVREQTLRYEYQDPALEGLDEASKHLLRFGPENQRRIQGALVRFSAALRGRLAARAAR